MTHHNSLPGPVRRTWTLLVFSLPFTDFLFFPEALKNAGQVSTFLIILLWVLFLLSAKPGTRVINPMDPVQRPLFWFLVIAALSILMSYRLPVSEVGGDVAWFKGLRQFTHLGLFISAFLFPLLLVKDAREFFKATRLFLTALSLVLAYGVLEIAAAFGPFRGIETILELFHWGSWYVVPGGGPILTSDTALGEIPRLRLVFAEPSMAAGFLAVTFPLLLGYSFLSSNSQRWKALAFVSLVCLLLTFSLTGYFIFLASTMGFILFLPGKRRKIVFISAVTFVCLLLMTIPILRDYLLGTTARLFGGDLSVAVRFQTVEAGIRMCYSNPLLGVGLGNSPFYIYDYLPWRPETAAFLALYEQTADVNLPVLNLFVRLFAETGLFGGWLFVLWHYRIFKTTRLAARRAESGKESLFGAVFSVTFVAVCLCYFGEGGFDKRFWPFLLGMAVAWARLPEVNAFSSGD